MKKKAPLPRTYGSMNRRYFLKLSGVAGLGLASAGVLPAAAETVKFNRKSYKVSKTRLAMGTFVSMTLIHSSRDKAEEAMGQAFEEIDRLTRLVNRFDQTTAVARLNQEGFLEDAPPEVAQVVARAQDYFHLSNGAFDVSVKPIVDLFRESFADGKNTPPSEIELKKALALVGADRIELKGPMIRFKDPGMGITLDGIAKGYIVDGASGVLVGQQINNYLINAGGDIRAMGVKRDKKPWTVAIQDPWKKRQYPDIVHMTDGAIATSGNYEVYFDREKMFHHIVHPRTGISPGLSASVSVLAKTAMAADALSTSVFVMNPVDGIRFINSIPDCEALVVASGGEELRSAKWKNSVS
ncbi:MAG: FAD:protein FMN transferase [Thermodesulfobacteriota bacterium]|nr:FAD:protein FMN transferase [Thermodesulfobacteriota bacterium]